MQEEVARYSDGHNDKLKWEKKTITRQRVWANLDGFSPCIQNAPKPFPCVLYQLCSLQVYFKLNDPLYKTKILHTTVQKFMGGGQKAS